jgi:hypothetical protein
VIIENAKDRRKHHPAVVLGSWVRPSGDLGHARVGASNFYNREDVLTTNG